MYRHSQSQDLTHYQMSVATSLISCNSIVILNLQRPEEHTTSLSKITLADGRDKDRWNKVLIMDMISSEGSGTDDEEAILFVHPLPSFMCGVNVS